MKASLATGPGRCLDNARAAVPDGEIDRGRDDSRARLDGGIRNDAALQCLVRNEADGMTAAEHDDVPETQRVVSRLHGDSPDDRAFDRDQFAEFLVDGG